MSHQITRCLSIVGLSAILVLNTLQISPAAAQTAYPESSFPDHTQAIVPADCSLDLDCFIQATRRCDPTKVTWYPWLHLFGMLWMPMASLEIRDWAGDACVVFIRIERVDVHLTQEFVDQSLASGYTLDDAWAAQHEASLLASSYAGLEVTCALPPEELAAQLSQWNTSGLTLADWGFTQCTGTGME